jgi:hypothetical protein
MDSPNFSNQQQERIYRRLKDLVGRGAAAFWWDACRLMEMEPPLESTTHLVGHLLREIESSLRDVLEPLANPPAKPHKCKHCGHQLENKCPNCNLQLEEEKPTHKDEIRSILDELKIPQTDKVAKSWLKLANRNDEYGLHRRAHRKDLAPPRPADQKFRQFWSEIQGIFDTVLDRFETLYSKVYSLLDELLKKSTPTKDDIKQLRLNIPNSFVALSYFFERLHSPEWLIPLRKKHFFEDPPDSDLPWPQSRYLVRMASQEPAIVLEIAQEILKTGTKNTSVHQDLAEAALVMPPKLAADWVKEETKWLKEQDYLYFSLPKKLGDLIVYLTHSEQVNVALGLVREILAVMPNKESGYPTQVRTRCDDYYYGKILAEYIPKLVSVAGEDTLRLLCDLLSDAIRFFQLPHENSSVEDYSYEWYRAFEGSWQNYRYDVRSLLAAAVWNATEQIVRENPLKIRFIVQTLENYQWRIFDRIVLHLLRRFPNEVPDLIAERLADRKRLNEPIRCYEYELLLKERFADLNSEAQEQILSWIAEGLEDTSWLKEEKITLYIKQWQRDWLAILSGSLPKEWQERYEQLVLEIGPAKSLEPPGEVNFRQGPVSPKLAEELAAMSMPELFTFLKQWQPSGDIFAPSRCGLAGELSKVIAQKPEDFIEEIEQFKEVDPEYIRSGFLRGLQNALKIQSEAQPKFYSWERVLEFCSWMLEELRELPESKAPVNGFEYWGWNQSRAVVELIDAGLNVKGENQIPLQLRSSIWAILEQLTNDPNLTPGFETYYRYSSGHPIDSVNTIRGKAMHAVVQYALWVQQHLQAESDGEVKAARGFDEIAEVRSLLERHLDPKHDPSLTIRSVYGQCLLYLMRLDLEWTTRNLQRIFPRNQEFQELRDSAWEGYITTYDPYNNIFPMLREEYSYAIERIDTSTPEGQNRSGANERLTEHLRELYKWGVLKLGDSDLLLERFFAKAPAYNRQAFMREIGRWLRYENCKVDTDLLERLQKLWEWRISEVRNPLLTDSQSSDLKLFSWWFASRNFDSNWAVTQLMEALRLAKHIHFDEYVLHYLVVLAPSMPLATVECLNLMADSIEGDEWFLSCYREDNRAILSAALQSKDEEARKAAKELINRLLVRGIDFRDLLSDGEV